LDHEHEARTLLQTEKDPELKAMAKDELDALVPQIEQLESEIKKMLIPKDPEDAKNAVLEIRAGTGGDEAGLFAADLFRMYARFLDEKGWKYTVLSATEGTLGGYKESTAKKCTAPSSTNRGCIGYSGFLQRRAKAGCTRLQPP
jgi:peptide chain release factor 1